MPLAGSLLLLKADASAVYGWNILVSTDGLF